jgi:hypothetical protein
MPKHNAGMVPFDSPIASRNFIAADGQYIHSILFWLYFLFGTSSRKSMKQEEFVFQEIYNAMYATRVEKWTESLQYQ